METEQNEQPTEEIYGPPMPGFTGFMKIGPLFIPGRLGVFMIFLLITLFNIIIAGLVVLLALHHAGKL